MFHDQLISENSPYLLGDSTLDGIDKETNYGEIIVTKLMPPLIIKIKGLDQIDKEIEGTSKCHLTNLLDIDWSFSMIRAYFCLSLEGTMNEIPANLPLFPKVEHVSLLFLFSKEFYGNEKSFMILVIMVITMILGYGVVCGMIV